MLIDYINGAVGAQLGSIFARGLFGAQAIGPASIIGSFVARAIPTYRREGMSAALTELYSVQALLVNAGLLLAGSFSEEGADTYATFTMMVCAAWFEHAWFEQEEPEPEREWLELAP
ncbi:MAG: hypothetical protein V3V61_00790 [Gammaproteobacteria bacterium]